MRRADMANKGRFTAGPHGRVSRPASNDDAFTHNIIKGRVAIGNNI